MGIFIIFISNTNYVNWKKLGIEASCKKMFGPLVKGYVLCNSCTLEVIIVITVTWPRLGDLSIDTITINQCGGIRQGLTCKISSHLEVGI